MSTFITLFKFDWLVYGV